MYLKNTMLLIGIMLDPGMRWVNQKAVGEHGKYPANIQALQNVTAIHVEYIQHAAIQGVIRDQFVVAEDL